MTMLNDMTDGLSNDSNLFFCLSFNDNANRCWEFHPSSKNPLSKEKLSSRRDEAENALYFVTIKSIRYCYTIKFASVRQFYV